MHGKPQTGATDAAKLKQVELWQLEKCDVRIKSWKARVIQSGALGAKRECLSKLVTRVKQDHIDDDAEDECNEEGLVRLFLSAVHRKPWNLSDEETNRV